MRIDHLVWYAPDLAEGERFFETKLGCKPAYGGVHSGEGTRNGLLSLGEGTYLEILAPDPAQPRSALDAELARIVGAGLYHWAVSGVDLASVIASARQSGLTASEIVSGGRSQPDGTRVSWRLVGLKGHRFGALAPFFIDWGASPHPAATAPRGGKLKRVEVFTPEVPALRRLYDALGLGDLKLGKAREPCMEAEIVGKSGSLIIKSIAPLPRGFVI